MTEKAIPCYPTPKIKELALGWRLMELSEIIQKGDVYWSRSNDEWKSFYNSIGKSVQDSAIHKRQGRNIQAAHYVGEQEEKKERGVLVWD